MKKSLVILIFFLSFAHIFLACQNNQNNNKDGHSHTEGHSLQDKHGHDHENGHDNASNNTASETDANLIGKWKAPDRGDGSERILVFKKQLKWDYFKDGEQVEKGTYHIKDKLLTLKHIIETHSHDDGEKHKHPKDHHYHYGFNDDKSELIFVIHGDTTVHKRIQ